MGMYYNIEGSVNVRSTGKSNEIFNRLNDLLDGDDLVAEREDENDNAFTIYVSGGGMYCSSSTASDIDSILREFSEFAIGVGKFVITGDEGDEILFVGEASEVEKAERNELIDKAREAIKLLTDDEREKLMLNKFYNVWFVWGSHSVPCHYSFDSVSELNAFLVGVRAASGWDDYKQCDSLSEAEAICQRMCKNTQG